MIRSILLALTILMFSNSVLFAQKKSKDSLFVVQNSGRIMPVHEVQKDENLYSIAQLYAVPALVLSQNNDVSFYESLEPKRKLYIPMGNYNYLKSKPNDPNSAKTLYYKVQTNDSYAQLAAMLGMPEDVLKSWNNNIELSKNVNAIVILGWITYQSPEIPKSNDIANPISPNTPSPLAGGTTTIVKKDTVKGPPTELELQYNYQTSNGQYVDNTSGMVVFFKPQTAVNSKLLYAFSNEIAKGRVLKIVNPTNNKFVFAKVIGPLPTTKQYINAKIGLDGRARAELETREIKLWCDIFLKY